MIVDLEVVNQNLTREVDTLKMEKEKLISDYQNLRKFVEHMISTPNFAGYMQEQVLGLSTQQNSMASPQVAQPRQRQRSQQTPQYGLPMIPEQNQTLQLADVLTDDALFPEDSMNDFGSMPMLSTQNSNDFDMFGENTGIFAVLDTPQPSIDISTLSGKTSNFVGQQEEFDSHDEKVAMPSIEKGPAPVKPAVVEKVETSSIVDEDFDHDPAFALYHQSTDAVESVSSDKPVEFDTDGLSHVDIFGGIELEKVFERYELVDASEEEVGAALAMERVQRISSTVESVMARLELMTINL
ncbi:hypothetical protein CONLIGDRAFT_633981 [Coniochaeta ligniaria NRRL 30616]|uniref:BZIP domain-containing protein n=1 Tax=Coniochaeta ligniaria NRRL 30616 TaxID=1408157 RepID=A0A1J7JD13_9PEZI|nr:hypothetical protein CONLIGDRAFT_633981 [Coniochaeta ligniaria NRRL 30616]